MRACLGLAVLLSFGCGIATVLGQVPVRVAHKLPAGKVGYAMFSFKGDAVYVGLTDGNISLWNYPDLKDYKPLTKMGDAITVAVFSYDGRIIASASADKQLQIWNQLTESADVRGVTDIVNDIAFSPDNRLYATADQGNLVNLFDSDQKAKYLTLKGHTDQVLALKFAPDGRTVLSAGADKFVKQWDVVSGKELASWAAHKDWVKSLDVSPDGKLLATTSYDKTVKIWSLRERNELLLTLEGHSNWVTKVCFSKDGQYLASGGHGGQVRVWRVATGELVAKLPNHTDYIRSLDFSTDGKDLLVADGTSKLVVYDVSALGIRPWQKPDIEAPTLRLLNPKKARSTSQRTEAVAFQANTRVLLQVTDDSGVKSVKINGSVVPEEGSGLHTYSANQRFSQHTETKLVVEVEDSLGNYTKEEIYVKVQDRKVVQSGQYHALLIGNSNYRDRGLTDLDKPIEDARRLRDVLVQRYRFNPSNIQLLEDADRNQMVLALDSLTRNLKPTDNLLIFYAGHGKWDEDLKQGYWYPVDASYTNPANWFPNTVLRDYIRAMPAQHVLLVADACFSGGIFKTRAADNDPGAYIEELYKYKSRKAITSGALNEVPDQSVFLDLLVKRLQTNDQVFLSAFDLFAAFRSSVVASSGDINQIPQYGEIGQAGDEGGDFIFILKDE